MNFKYFLMLGAVATGLFVFTAADGNTVEDQMKKINATVEAETSAFMADKKAECKSNVVRDAEAKAADICATRGTKTAVVAPAAPAKPTAKPAVKPGKTTTKGGTTKPMPNVPVQPSTPAPKSTEPANNGRRPGDATNDPDAVNGGRRGGDTPAPAPTEAVNRGRRGGL